jgi:TrpR-related protein YerC/YecD
MKSLKNESNDKLFRAILELKNVGECYNFFEDICTYKEIDAMATRLESAKLLDKGFTYEEILKKIEISSATLSRVSRALKYGPGGYKMIIDRVKK